ncbi:MAG: hypothetical protein E6F97_00600 [Actinobacteria bacterium]|nr:MAG: hypothetical protein E6F97_00600 [Actinomycetota bacterium]
MNRPLLPRLAAACGVVFPIALFLAVGNGNSFAPWRAVASTWALVLFLPFLAYLCGLLRTAARDDGWLPTLALVAGASGVLLKLVSHAPELAIHQDHIAKGTPLYKALDHTAGAATTLCLYPLAIYAAAVAIIVLREQVLPRWVGVFAVLTAAALVVNGAFVFAGFVPALLLFLLWTLVTAIVVLRRTWVASTQVAYAT